MTSGGSLPREVMLSSFVGWKIIKFNGKTLTKLIGCVGFMPKEWPPPPKTNVSMLKAPSFVNFIKKAVVCKKVIMKIMVKCISMFVSIAIHKGSHIPTPEKIVKTGQKTTWALLKCSAK